MAIPDHRLRSEIDVVLARMEQARDRSDRLSEADTRAAFIDPILSALGWDLRDVYSVSREYRHKPQDNPVDYALFVSRSPVLFVEAKALSKDLSDYRWITQTIAYANAAGVEWCLLSNGDEYRIYNAFAKADAERKLFRRFRISDRNESALAIATLQLLTSATLAEKRIEVLWKAHFVDRQVREAVLRLFRTPDEALVRLLVRSSTDLRVGDVRESLRRADVDLRYSAPAPATGRAPKASNRNTSPPTSHVTKAKTPSGSVAPPNRVRVIDLIEAGVISPPAEIEVTFRKRRFTATIDGEGRIRFDGTSYDSPSLAGGMVRVKVNGPPPDGSAYYPTNGWTFWNYRDSSTGKLLPIAKWRELLPSTAAD